MKIYNEIVIDMNPESSSFEEVLHEDSFEYNRAMVLAQGEPYKEGDEITYGTGYEAYTNVHTGEKITPEEYKQKKLSEMGNPDLYFDPNRAKSVNESSNYTSITLYDRARFLGGKWLKAHAMGSMEREQLEANASHNVYKDFSNIDSLSSHLYDQGLMLGSGIEGMEGQTEGGTTGLADWILQGKAYKPEFDVNNDGKLDVLDINAGAALEREQAGTGLSQSDIEGVAETPFTFTYDEEGEFDPTSGEFKQYVQHTGGYDALLEGFDLKAEDKKFFEPLSTEPLGYLQEERALGEAKLGIDMQTLSENLRKATESYGMARRKTGMQAGQSLFDIRSQVEGAQGKTGFAGTGAIASTAGRAQRGVFQDYQMQQKELASGMKGAQTAFDLGQQDIALGRKGIDIDYRKGVSDFWKTEEEKFYDRLMEVESFG